MALHGDGMVAIWHDIAPEGRADFYAWHGEQHMPERAGIPGFIRGRRYVAVRGVPEFFNLYETAGLAVLTGRDYLERLNHPTSWTVTTVQHFRNVARALCTVEVTHGRGDGGLVATFRHEVAPPQAAAHRAAMRTRLAEISREPGVAGVHLLVADPAASGIETAERKARTTGTEVPGWCVLVEWWGDETALVTRCAALVRDPVFGAVHGSPDWAIYRLQNACPHGENGRG